MTTTPLPTSPVVLWLRRAQADTFCLYAAAHAFHWNVRGPGFPQLHGLFGDQYEELFAAVDLLAERVRALQALAPNLAEMAALCTYSLPAAATAQEMVAALLGGHEAACATACACFDAADAEGDQATMNMMADRQAAHEKAAWMLRSTLAPE